MKKFLIPFSVLLLSGFIFAAESTVSKAVKMPNKSSVDLIGTLTSQIDSDEYIFTDSTGSVKVEFKKTSFPNNITQNLSLNTKIKIRAVVDNEILERTELEVLRFKYLEAPAGDNF